MSLPEGRRPRTVTLAFGTLFLMMAAHAMLESARDALLLGALSPVALLWSYVGIAALAVVTTRLRRGREPTTLTRMLVGAAVLTLTFRLLLPYVMPSGAVAFYVYTGILATLIVPQLWLALALRFTVGEAKRHYSTIGLGGLAGAGAGSALATFLLRRVAVRDLLIAGAIVYLAGAVIAWSLERAAPRAKTSRSIQARTSEPKTYVRRLTLLALVASATLTIIDYVFKSATAATIPSAELGAYFARVYTTINVIALLVQAVLVPRMLKHLGTHAAATVLPLLLLLGMGSFAFVAIPVIVLAVKGADGALRNSLHRITMELFYFPLPDDARNRWKAAADAFGQRGGQAAGALVTLGMLAAGADLRGIAILATVLSSAWLVLVQTVRKPYVELFRATLRRGSMPANVAPLGSKTLQAMLEALSSPDDAVVCAALDFLVLHGNVRLVPAVMVYHPSSTVAKRALEHLITSGRSDVPQIIERLTSHSDPMIRLNALRAHMRHGASVDELTEALDDASVDVRTAAMTLLHRRLPHRRQASALIDEIVKGECVAAKLSLARAIGEDPAPELASFLLRLLETPDVHVRNEALAAIARGPDRAYLPALLPFLGDRRLVGNARRAILASSFGDSSVVETWLCDETLPPAVRRHIPRTLSAFESEQAAAALLGRLETEPDGAVRFKILRGLGRMRADQPQLRIDKRLLQRALEANLDRAIHLLEWRVALADGEVHPMLETLLLAILRDKEERALERVFRVLGILHPECELERVWRGIHSNDPGSRDASLELVDQLDRGERRRLVAMLEPAADAVRLRASGRRPPTRERALEELATDPSLPLRETAHFLLEQLHAAR